MTKILIDDLDQSGANDGDKLVFNGTTWAPSSSPVLEASLTAITPFQDVPINSLNTMTINIANRAVLMPFSVARTTTVKRIAIWNGNSINGRVDVGIYNPDGTLRVSSGGFNHSGINAAQVFNITDEELPPGSYFMALVATSNTTRFFGPSLGTARVGQAGIKQQDSAYPLPSTVSVSTNYGASSVPFMVLLTES